MHETFGGARGDDEPVEREHRDRRGRERGVIAVGALAHAAVLFRDRADADDLLLFPIADVEDVDFRRRRAVGGDEDVLEELHVLERAAGGRRGHLRAFHERGGGRGVGRERRRGRAPGRGAAARERAGRERREESIDRSPLERTRRRREIRSSLGDGEEARDRRTRGRTRTP